MNIYDSTLDFIVNFYNAYGSYPSHRDMANSLGVSHGAIYTRLQRMKALDLIEYYDGKIQSCDHESISSDNSSCNKTYLSGIDWLRVKILA